MTPQTEEKMIDRIQKLLNKAHGTTNEHERAAFLAKAEALIEEHKIDWAKAVQASGGVLNIADIGTATCKLADNQYQVRMWKITVASAVARYYGVRVLLQNRATQVLFIAPKHLLEVIVPWFTFLCNAIEEECAVEYERAEELGLIGKGFGKVNGKTWRTRCLDVAASTLSKRLSDKKARENADYVTTAIVPVLTERLNEYIQEEIGRVHNWSQSYHTGYNASATNAGTMAGSRVRIDQSLKTGGKELKS